MTSSYIAITYGQLALSAGLILVNLALSVALRLGLEKTLAIAALRMVVQLLLVGYVLEWVFALQQPQWILLLALVMTAIAGRAVTDRTKRRFTGLYWNSFLSILAAGALVSGFTVVGIVRPDPWYEPQYLIPLFGMVLGNALNGTSLALDRFMEELVSHRDRVETLLALGATRWEAALPAMREAIRTGMIPSINSMAVMGIVSLPGMMTGQILAGASPDDAVRYQIAIMFAIVAGTALASIGIVLLGFRSLFDSNHQLRLDRLQGAL